MAVPSYKSVLGLLLLLSVTDPLPTQAARILLVTQGFNTNSAMLEAISAGEEMAARGHDVYLMLPKEKEDKERSKKIKVDASIHLVEYRASVTNVSFDNFDRALVQAAVEGSGWL
jgi:hypothetical protein